jgi:hypothetical protein
MKYLLILLLFCSCSAEYHLKQALKKNPKLGDSAIKYVPYIKDTTIYVKIYVKGDSTTQNSKQIIDSLQRVFNDSFTTVYQLVDSLGNVKTNVVRKPFYVHDSINVIICDTIQTKCPPQIIVEEGYNKMWFWLLIVIFVGIYGLTIYLIK